ncbi:MAG: hypothetical protein JRI92_14030, partial [Deltaproteobacteria bacterium]|nr:hypothetical protein [Deltaproteobacteria bacterium]
YLQSNSAGRSGFIPISTIRQIEYGQQGKPDPSKLLLNHVSVKEGFENITSALLGHVLVADDIQEAKTIFNSNGALQTIVTKDGDILSHQGLIIGGSKDNFTGIFTKKQEIRDLKHSISDLDRKLESARADQTDMESELRMFESDLQKLIEEKSKVAGQEVEAEKDFYKASEDLKHCRHHLEIVRLEQQQLMGEESDADEEMAEYNKALSEISDQIVSLQNTVAKKTAQADSISAQANAFDQETVELKLKLTSLNARLENITNTARRLKEFLDDNIEQLEQLTAEINRKNQKGNSLKQKIKEFEHNLYANYEDIKILEHAIDKNEDDYQKIDSTLKDSDDNISDIRKQREKVSEKLRMLELEQAQRHLRRENIENRLIERYHITIAEIKTGNEKMSNELKQTVKMSPDEMEEQRDDLVKAVEDLQKVIRKIDRITQDRFVNTLNLVNEKLCEVFPRLFEGGTAQLVLSQPDNPLETGVEFMIHPPGKKLTRMRLLSGGEKALSAIAFIFSLFLIKPTSFCLLDEIDAPLDDVNVYRFNDLLQLIGKKSQIVMVTHNKSSMEFADTLFGITMEQKGISKVVSVNFEQRKEMVN